MFCCGCRAKAGWNWRRVLAACVVLGMGLVGVGGIGAQTVKTYSFEDGTADGWTSFNGATTPTATNAAADDGTFSLLTTTGSSGQGGPSVNASNLLQAGAKYTITGFVKLTPGETPTNANFTIRRTDPTCCGRHVL